MYEYVYTVFLGTSTETDKTIGKKEGDIETHGNKKASKIFLKIARTQ